MAERSAASFIYLLAFGCCVAAFASPVSYIDIGLDNEAICNPSKDNTLTVDLLKNKKDSAIMIKPSHVFKSWLSIKYNKHCRFKIKAAKNQGLFAVIQKMSLRRNGSECLDFVQFTAENLERKELSRSEKFCGTLNNFDELKYYRPNLESVYDAEPIDEEDSNDFPRGMFEISSTAGKIVTEIYVSKHPLHPGEALDLLIAYTPFTECESTGLNLFNWFKRPQFKNICIDDRFHCDRFTNCASGMCFDEKNCTSTVPKLIVSDETGTKVTVSAVTTIILCFIIFILCMWICRKQKKLCWSPDCAGPTTTVSGSATGMPMEPGEQSASNPPLVASAPMLEVAVPTSLHDKDLPPSYDSLFPTQISTNANTNTNTATT